MKRNLTLFSALLLTLSMWGAYEYDATINGVVTLTDLTYEVAGEPYYKYQLDFAQVGVNRNGGTAYNSVACIILEPLEEGIAGTYKLSDMSINKYSYVLYNTSTRYVCDYTGNPTEIVIKDNQDGSYTISGAFRTKSGNSYYYYFYDGDDAKNTFIPVAPDPYKDEPAKGDDINFNGNSLYTKAYADNILELDITDAYYNEMVLDFNADKDTLVAGTYNVGTEIVASLGMDGYYAIPSFYTTTSLDNYFIVDGSLNVSYSTDLKKLLMTGDLETGHGTTIKVNIEVNNPWTPVKPTGIENQTTTLKVNKLLKNGQLMLFKDDKVYNAQAQEL